MKVPPPEIPSAALHYGAASYLDPEKVERELRRTGEVCHQCRRCLPLCPAFPRLFELIDATDREIAGVSMAGFDEVNELCFHCKLCYNHCPYTPPHEWDIDFPALMRRQQQVRAARDGVPLARRLTTRTDWIGRLGSLTPALMNFANRNALARAIQEKLLGIHRDWIQPSFHRETVKRWFARRPRAAVRENGHAVLFTTCSVNYNDPETGKAAVEVLERSGVRVDLCYERCCGMPFTDTGDLEAVRRNARANVADLLPYVDAGATVVAPGPSCSLMLKTEYPKLLGSAEAERVAAHTKDLMEYVYELARAKKLSRDFKSPLGRIAYHAPCHLRAQNIGFRSRDVLQLAADEVVLVDACSGVDGTWGMQKRFYGESMQVASGMLARLRAVEPDWVSTDCPLASLRIEKGLGVKPLHPVVLLRRAYQELTP
ncbi:MAG TPA: heterodisulfide reductase-related iron-sulfur binding cluster [Myxococcota bacterium]|nr:heterodisulfide reductase-related iron-sulfur binding cluster [Myxococcota bacterium]